MTKERKGLTHGEFQRMLNEAAENAVDKHFTTTTNTPATDFVKALGLDGSDAKKAKENVPGWRFATLVKTIVATGNDYNAVRQVAAELGDGNAIKSMQAGDLTAGGAFIGGDIAAEFIELLRPASAVRSMNPVTMELPKGVKDLPVFTGSATASYVAEGVAVNASEHTTGLRTLTARKLMCVVPVTNELLRFGEPNTEQAVVTEMVRAVGQTEDAQLLRGDGMVNQPKGLRHLAQAANITATNGPSSDNIEDDFTDMLEDLDGNNVPDERRHGVMASRSKNHLRNLRDSNGNLIFPEIRTTSPTLYGYPVIVSNQVPTNLGGGTNETELYLAEASDVIVGTVAGIEVSVEAGAAYVDSSGTVKAGFSQDETVVRIIMHSDIQVRHAESVAVKTAVVWGA